VEGIDGESSQDDMLGILNKYGITNGRIALWGTGTPFREFLWSEDMADACVYIMERVSFDDLKGSDPEVRNCHINIGTGKEITIKQLAELVKTKVGFEGELFFDTTKPDGTMRKLTDPQKLHELGWHHRMEIEDGIETMYRWYLS
jgi:GDP-L-fucose synthase